MAVDTSSMTWNEVLLRAASAYLNGTGDVPSTVTDILAELEAIATLLATPAASLPPPVPVAAGNTTFARTVVNISSATDTTLVAAVSGQVTRLHKGTLVIAGANVLTFKRGSTAITGPLTFGAGGGTINFNDPVYAELATGTNEALVLTTTTTAAVGGVIQTITSA